MLQLYNMLMVCYGLLTKLAAVWNTKARQIVSGREASLQSLVSWRNNNEPVVWIHCASLGEYEQVVPLLQMIKARQSQTQVALTFYSPSGYIPMKDKAVADWVGYLPNDTHRSMSAFIKVMAPHVAIWVKNEWWWSCLSILQSNKVPVHIVSATVRSDQYWVKWRLPFIDRVLANVRSIGVVDESSAEKLPASVRPSSIYVSGDMRADRVLAIAEQEPPEHFLFKKLAAGRSVIIYGSMWLHDSPAFEKLYNMHPHHIHIMFPHDLSDQNVAKMAAEWEAEIVTSETRLAAGRVYIVAEMGLLSAAYRFAQLVYVGGGYGKGVHNVLEAAVYGQLTVVGPKHHKSSECLRLLASGAVVDSSMIGKQLDINSHQIADAVNHFFKHHKGAVDRTYRLIFDKKANT